MSRIPVRNALYVARRRRDDGGPVVEPERPSAPDAIGAPGTVYTTILPDDRSVWQKAKDVASAVIPKTWEEAAQFGANLLPGASTAELPEASGEFSGAHSRGDLLGMATAGMKGANAILGAVPIIGGADRAALDIARRTQRAIRGGEGRIADVIKRGEPLEPRTPMPSPEQVAAARADTRTSGDIVNQRLGTIVPEQERVAGGTYTPGAPGGGRWADRPDLLAQRGIGFRSLTDEDLARLWQESVDESSAAAKRAVDQHNVRPTFSANDWHQAMSLPVRDHLWYELSGEKMAENLPDLTPSEHMKMLDVVGATSARAKPGENLERTLGTMSQHMRGAPVDVDLTQPAAVRQALSREHGNGTSALPGNKTGHFSDTLALTGGVPSRFPISVNDVWVGKMFGVPDEVMSSNQSLHEPMAKYFNKLRDLYNERHAAELPFKYQSWNFQAPAWVHLRNQEAGSESGDAYHQVWGGIIDKLNRAGVPGIQGDKITRDALMDPRFADALRRQTPGFRNAPKATVEFGTTQTPTGRQAHDLYQQAIERGDQLSQSDYLKGLTTAMYASARGSGHPWDRLKKAVTGDVGGKSDITRIMHPTTEAPFDVGSTFEGAVSPNIRIPLKGMSEQQQAEFNAVAGRHLRQDAMATSHILGAEPGSAPREGYTRGHSIFVPTTDQLAPDQIRGFAKELAPHGHNLSFVRYPNGYHFDVLPAFGEAGPRGVDKHLLDEAYGRTLGSTHGAATVAPHDFKSVYTEASDYAPVRSGLTRRIRDEYIQSAAKAGISRSDALAALKAPEGSVLPRGGQAARDVYRQRLDHLAGAEQGLKELAQRVADAHQTFIGKATKRFAKPVSAPVISPPYARGGMIDRALLLARKGVHTRHGRTGPLV